MKKRDTVISVLCYIVFAVIWLGIAFSGFLAFSFDFNELIPFSVKIVFVIAALVMVTFPLYSKLHHPKRACIAVVLPVVLVICYGLTRFGIVSYYSDFTHEKWIEHQYQRYLMIDSLESQYTLEGMTGDEIIELLGEPSVAQAGYGVKEIPSQYFYEYCIAQGLMDPLIYRIVFENGIVVKTVYIYT